VGTPRPARLRAATRGSPLALWQTRHVAALLGVEVDEVVVETTGDQRLDVPIHEIGGQGVFAKEVQAAVLDGRADFAVHSAKDLQPRPTPGLVLAAVPPRGEVRDALVGCRLGDLPAGAQIATGSVRRRAQLAWLRPDLTFAGLRGNIATRLGQASRYGAVVVAMAALERLGLADHATELLTPSDMLPQVGQGALAVECRADDNVTRAMLAGIEKPGDRAAVDAERAFLDAMGGGCDLPVGGWARAGQGGVLEMDVLIASLDGRVVIRRRASQAGHVEPGVLGAQLAAALMSAGAADLLGLTPSAQGATLATASPAEDVKDVKDR
jgi:hydroxymethylbilane synthase